MKMKNHPIRVTLLLLAVFAILLLLRLMPPFELGTVEIKKTDILADIIKTDGNDDGGEAAMLEALRKQKPAFRDSCPPGMTCIEDYAEEGGCGMEPFYRALEQIGELDRPVRIAYLGDSFIEGDIITDALREMLQDRFGAGGLGYVDVASEMIELRPTIAHQADGWVDANIMKKQECNTANLSMSGHYAEAQTKAFVDYRLQPVRRHIGPFEQATLFVKPASCSQVSVARDGGPAESISVTQSTTAVATATVSGPMSRVRFDVPSGTIAYGVALENHRGIVVDNFSIRGCSGTPLNSIPESHLQAINTLRPYDLVIIHFGLNVANKKQKNYSGYASHMKEVIDRFKRSMPHTALLVVSISDREDKVGGKLETAPGVMQLLAAQQQMAIDGGVAFWNLFEAMGGAGSIKEMADRKPAEARKDYTHINRRGGDRIADILCRSLLHGFESYKKNNEQ